MCERIARVFWRCSMVCERIARWMRGCGDSKRIRVLLLPSSIFCVCCVCARACVCGGYVCVFGVRGVRGGLCVRMVGMVRGVVCVCVWRVVV